MKLVGLLAYPLMFPLKGSTRNSYCCPGCNLLTVARVLEMYAFVTEPFQNRSPGHLCWTSYLTSLVFDAVHDKTTNSLRILSRTGIPGAFGSLESCGCCSSAGAKRKSCLKWFMLFFRKQIQNIWIQVYHLLNLMTPMLMMVQFQLKRKSQFYVLLN